MRKKKVTMLDIATAVGVSQPTVSVIINGSDSIKVSDDTRKRVLDQTRIMGYPLKSNIRHGQSHRRIALMVNSINMHDPFVEAISAAKKRAWDHDCILVVFDFEDDEQLKAAMLKEIELSNYLGLIFASNTPKEIITNGEQIAKKLVYLNCLDPESESAPAILVSDFMGGYRATEHLIKSGYKRIAMITGEVWSESSIQRLKGFRQAMSNYDVPIQEENILEGNWSVKESFQKVRVLLNSETPPEAIFCASDLMALGCYQAIAEKGLKIPEDIAVMGYDNQLLASQITPGLSSVDLPYDDMAKKAVDVLLAKRPPELTVMKIDGELILRNSTNKKIPN